MTSERPPRGRPRPRPKGFDDVPVLSDEEVERRVGVRGGGTPRGPIERPVRAPRPPRPPERTVARDSLLLIGLVVVGLVAVRLLLPDGPLTGTASQEPGNTETVIGSVAPGTTSAPSRSPGLLTLPPMPTPSDGLESAVPSGTLSPTAIPGPTPTLRPGETPKPTPKPTTPGPTPTTGPTQPGTATVIVVMNIENDSGGTALASAWTMKITGEVGSGVSPNNFPGSGSGTPVTITAGKGYLVTDNLAVAGYGAPSPSDDCHRDPGVGLAAGTTVTCTITRNDVAPRLNLTISIVGADPPNNPVLAITGADASPSSISSIGTTAVTLDANAPFSVTESTGISGYSLGTSGTCSSSGLALAATVGCTFTYTETPPSPGTAFPILLLPLLPARRWRTIPSR